MNLLLRLARRRMVREIARLHAQLDHVQHLLDQPGTLATRVPSCSAWTVCQHLEHLALATDVMLARIEDALQPEGSPGSAGARPIGRLVLATRYIPRGKAPAPNFTVPCNVSLDELKGRFSGVTERLKQLEPQLDAVATSSNRTPHPILGNFTPSQWVRFMAIHQQHHLDIIQDVLKRAS